MNSLEMLASSAVTYLVFHVMFYRMAEEVLEGERIGRAKILLLFLINYLFMVVYSILQINLVFNWVLIFAFLLFTLGILFRKNTKIRHRNIAAVALMGAIIGLSINIIARCLFVLILDIPLSHLNNNTLDPQNMKQFPIAIAFLVSGLLLYGMRKSIWKTRMQAIFRGNSDMGVFLLLLAVVFCYQVLILFLFYSPGNDLSLKIWGIVPNVFALFSIFAIIKFMERLGELGQYRQRNQQERRALQQVMAEEEKLEETAESDPMTGCKVRSYLETAFDAAKKRKAGFLLCFVDLDGLKKINDAYGHEAGDRYIRMAAKALKEQVRAKTDVVIRFGGDEFVLLIASQDQDEVSARMDQVNLRLKQMQQEQMLPFVPSISYGLASSDERDSLEDLLELSDQRMYRMKREKGTARQ